MMPSAQVRAARKSEIEQHYRDRLVMLSDGIFAIATTLAALDVRFVVTGDDLLRTVAASSNGIIAYGVSFVITAIFWISSRDLFSRVQRVDIVLTVLTLAMLAFIALVPATVRTAMQGASGTARFQVYAASVWLCAVFNSAAWLWVTFRPGLMAMPPNDEHRNRRLIAAVAVPIMLAAVLLLPLDQFVWVLIPVAIFVALLRWRLLPRLGRPALIPQSSNRRSRKRLRRTARTAIADGASGGS